MTLPNFLIIGAAKSGTTALYHYMRQHPQIYMSEIKEPHFFAFKNQNLSFVGPGVTINESSITQIDDYTALFQDIEPHEAAIGEASALYLYVPNTAQVIKDHIPNVKLIVILRNPIERAYASYMQLMRDGREPLGDFGKALEAEQGRIQGNWGFLWRYTDLGFYGAQLKQYFNLFDKEQIRVYLYDDFKEAPTSVLSDMFDFIGVENTFSPDMSIRPNVSGVPKNPFVHKFLTEKNPIKSIIKPLLPSNFREKLTNRVVNQNLSKPGLDHEVKRQLCSVFHEDILELQTMIGRDLSFWLTPSA